jgi:hypothetical protein
VNPIGGAGEHMAMLAVGSKIVVAYNPRGHSSVRFFCSSDGGESFKPTGETRGDGFGGASLALYKSKVYIAFYGGSNDRNINVAQVTLNGSGCPTDVKLATKFTSPISTDAPPLLLGTDNHLLVGWMNRPDAAVNVGIVNVR